VIIQNEVQWDFDCHVNRHCHTTLLAVF